MDLWSLSLTVETDDEQRHLTPRVRIGGGGPFRWGIARVTLVDPDEGVHGSVRRLLLPKRIGIELRFSPITLPEGVSVEDGLRWGWDVAVETDGLERIRWRRYLEVETTVGEDAEIRLAGPTRPLRSKAEDEGWGPEAPWDVRDSDRLLSALVAEGLIGEAERKSVLAEAASSGSTVERGLVDGGHLDERTMLERYADVTGCELLDLETSPIDEDAAARIPEEISRLYGLVAVGYRGDMLAVAMSDPQNLQAIRAVEYIDHPYRPYIALATREDVLRALERLAEEPEPVVG